MISPQLLTHPHIPRPLHGTNPRSILGQSWWDSQRRTAYAKQNHHCWACGVHETKAPYRQLLEAHEQYDYDYEHGRAELKEIVALCHRCHNFIHSERLWWQYQQGKIPQSKLTDVLQYGVHLLSQHHLIPHPDTLKIASSANINLPEYMQQPSSSLPQEQAKWEDWRLVLNGEEYPGKFSTQEDWAAYYNLSQDLLHNEDSSLL